MKVLLKSIFLSLHVKGVVAFAPANIGQQSTTTLGMIQQHHDNHDNDSMQQHSNLNSRKEFIHSIMKASLVVSSSTPFLFSSPSPALADVTNKVASKSALRYIKRSIKELEKLELYASTNDYAEIKQGLRSPALSEVRKNASVLIKGGEDGPDAEMLVSSYGTFIKDVEKLDGDASLGFRGRKGIELYPAYSEAVKDLKIFEEIAAKATDIPLSNSSSAE